MWYEILPSFMIITVALAVPHYIAYPINWLVVGNRYRRELLEKPQRLQYLRDCRLKDPYAILGLEQIPDEPEEEEQATQEEAFSGDKKC